MQADTEGKTSSTGTPEMEVGWKAAWLGETGAAVPGQHRD